MENWQNFFVNASIFGFIFQILLVITVFQITKNFSSKKHNKEMRRIGAHNLQMDLEQYIAYCHGEHKPRTKSAPKADWLHEGGTVWERPQTDAPSLMSKDSFAPCTKKETVQYTGKRKLVGIATMHKSNMVPIFADEDDKNGSKQATEIATMRRG